MTVACAGLAVYAAVLAIPVSVLAIPVKKSYGFSKSGTTFWREWLSRSYISHSRIWDSHSSVHQ